MSGHHQDREVWPRPKHSDRPFIETLQEHDDDTRRAPPEAARRVGCNCSPLRSARSATKAGVGLCPRWCVKAYIELCSFLHGAQELVSLFDEGLRRDSPTRVSPVKNSLSRLVSESHVHHDGPEQLRYSNMKRTLSVLLHAQKTGRTIGGAAATSQYAHVQHTSLLQPWITLLLSP